ncbi:biotin synthase BioB [Kiloniella laminariae]|uniref:Biotin synthase n=2 Tax=Kiloniella laminariae TaxID=454162 RepID=A0ABT4LM06_9PROT|nr:biotin synthase BioB [Kiloniella laminariae]
MENESRITDTRLTDVPVATQAITDTVAAENTETSASGDLRTNWTREEIEALYDLPLMDLLFQAQTMHRKYFDPNKVQLSTLLNIKQGGCAEDCKYCSQSSRYQTDVGASKLMDKESVVEYAKKAKANGSGRFCMGAAWRNVKDRDIDKIAEIVTAVKDLGMETCMTLGMLNRDQADSLKEAGLDYYNHNIDTSPEYYPEVITTRSFEDRIETLSHVREAGLNVCSGGIIGMGEERKDRVGLLMALANLPKHPGSVPINMLVPVKGTPFGDMQRIDSFEMVRTVAVARLMMPKSYVRLSAGRRSLGDEGQALCFMAGANSIFYGDKLLTTANPEENEDMALFARLGLATEQKGAVVEHHDAAPRGCGSPDCGCV